MMVLSSVCCWEHRHSCHMQPLCVTVEAQRWHTMKELAVRCSTYVLRTCRFMLVGERLGFSGCPRLVLQNREKGLGLHPDCSQISHSVPLLCLLSNMETSTHPHSSTSSKDLSITHNSLVFTHKVQKGEINL